MKKASRQWIDEFTGNVVWLDSDEEVWFYGYCTELQKAGIIEKFNHIDKPINIVPAVTYTEVKPMKRVADKIITKTAIKPIAYTPDFYIEFTDLAVEIGLISDLFCSDITPIKTVDKKCIIEVKADYDFQNMTRQVKVRIAMFYHTYKMYVNIAKLPYLFAETFYPEAWFNKFKRENTKQRHKLNKKTINDYKRNT